MPATVTAPPKPADRTAERAQAVLAALARLTAMHEEEILTDEEFRIAKANLGFDVRWPEMELFPRD